MAGGDSRSKFMRSLAGEVFSAPPVWFMRQAGRYLPEYREVRARAGGFLELCYNPELASEVTLQPVRRFDVDAAILFADILLLPHAMGQTVVFESGDGPRLSPTLTAATLAGYETADIADRLAPVMETIRRTRAALGEDKALIGFAGAPWTVATYMLGGGPMKDPAALRSLAYTDPGFLKAVIDLLTRRTIDYLTAQIDAGVDAVQLFDTWAGGLPSPVLEAVSVRPLAAIAEAVSKARPGTPVILFPKGVGEKSADYLHWPGVTALGIDYAMDPAWARAHLGPHVVVQGGLDPLLVVEGGNAMRLAAMSLLKLFHDTPYIFNLGHGLTPPTPPENVAALVELVRAGGKG